MAARTLIKSTLVNLNMGMMITLPLVASAQVQLETYTTPVAVFEGQSFEASYSPQHECVSEYGDVTEVELAADRLNVVYEIRDYDLGCASASPALPGPWARGYINARIEGLSAGFYTVVFSGVYDGDVVTSSTSQRLEILSIDDYIGTGQLHFGFGSPKPDEVVSGIGLIRGWACRELPMTIGRIGYSLDGSPEVTLPYGSSRADTQSRCEGRFDNGFGGVINWNRFEQGEHTITLLIDGEEVATRTFEVSGTGESFLRGVEAEYQLDDFPETGEITTVRWSESAQNFIIVGVETP